MKRPVDFGNPEEVRAFLGAVRDLALDAIASGEDATRISRRRMFSH